MQFPIYLDNAATTRVDPRVVGRMLPFLHEQYGNAASATHDFGRAARKAVEMAREEVAQLVGARPDEIIWTSGATESNNLALKGTALAGPPGARLVSSTTEHKAVLDTLTALEQRGFTAELLAPDFRGLIAPAQFAAALRPGTALASIMLVNNEIGVIQDVAAMGAACRERGILFHVDAAQATGKLDIDVTSMNIDLLSLTAHKTYGPKGVGALYVRRDIRSRLVPQMHGGGHEHGLSSGTLATHQIVGMGGCLRIAREEMEKEVPRIRMLRDRLWHGLRDLKGVSLNGDLQQRVVHNLNISVDVPGSEMLMASLTDIAISAASACVAGSASHVLQALAGSTPVAGQALRITIGRFNTVDEIDHAVRCLRGRIEACLNSTAGPAA